MGVDFTLNFRKFRW